MKIAIYVEGRKCIFFKSDEIYGLSQKIWKSPCWWYNDESRGNIPCTENDNACGGDDDDGGGEDPFRVCVDPAVHM